MPETAASHSTITRRVYAIIALFIALIVGLTVLFMVQMDSLIAIRAFVGTENLWAKAEKDAVLILKRYGESRDEADYGEFQREIQVPLGDQLARVELQKPNPDLDLVREGFLQGRNHPDDIEYMIPFFRYFQHTPYVASAIRYWTEGDRLIGELIKISDGLRDEVSSGRADPVAIRAYIARLDDVDHLLTALEVAFSATLAETSRWAHDLFRTMTYAVVFLSVVFGVGLSWPLVKRIRATAAVEHEREERLRGIFENVNDIIFVVEADQTLSSVSPSATRKLGWSAEETVGQPFLPFVHRDDRPTTVDLFLRAQAGQQLPVFQVRVLMKGGGYLETEIVPNLVHHDGSIAILGVLRDITERKRMEENIRKLNEVLEEKVEERTRQLMETQEELVRKEKLSVLGQVSGLVGHELRNPLGVMSNAIYFLQTMLADADDSTKEYLTIIKDEIANAERIVSDLLDAVRTKPPQVGTVGLEELIGQTLQKCSVPSAVAVKLNIPPALPPLRVDAMQMEQVFRNLITNGVEAMPEGGTLEIGAVANAADRTVTVSVRDSGAGIAPEAIKRLFQPLFTTKARGIGLGLVVVKNLTQANGGTVTVASEAGKGATFSVTLPAGRVTETAP